MEQEPYLDYEQLELLAKVLDCLGFVDPDLGCTLDLQFIVFVVVFGRDWREEAVSVVEQEVDIQPEVEAVDLEEDVVVVLEGCINGVMLIQLPQLVLLHRNVERANTIERFKNFRVAYLHLLADEDL